MDSNDGRVRWVVFCCFLVVMGLAARCEPARAEVNAYRGPMHDGTNADLALLIHYVSAIDGIERIRFTTSHPVEFSDR